MTARSHTRKRKAERRKALDKIKRRPERHKKSSPRRAAAKIRHEDEVERTREAFWRLEHG